MRGLRVARIVPISHTDDDTLPGVFRELLISYAPAALSDALVADAVACAVRVRLVDLSDGVMVCIGSQAA